MHVRRSLNSIAPKFVRDLVVLAGGQLAGKLIGLVVFAMLARTLRPEGYGAVEFVIGLAGFLAIAIDGGLGTIAVKRIGEDRERLPLLAVQIPLARLVIAVVAMPILVVAVEAFGPPSIPRGLALLFAGSLLFAAFNQEWLLQGCELMGLVATVQILRIAVFAAAIFMLVQSPADITAIGWAEIVAAAVASACYLGFQYTKVARERLSLALNGMWDLGRESAPIGIANFVWAAAQFLPLFLVGTVVGGAQIGWYAAAHRLVTSVSTFSYVYHFNLYPSLTRASSLGSEEFEQLVRASFRVMAWLSIGFALCISLAAPALLTGIFGAGFAPGATVLSILVWAVPVMFMSGHARLSLIVAGAQRRIPLAQCAGLATVAVTGAVLAMLLGARGAAIAAVAGNVAVWMVMQWFALRGNAKAPALMLAARPLTVAIVVGAAASIADTGWLTRTAGGGALYFVLMPLLDREFVPDLLRLAEVKSMTSRPRRT